MVGISLSARLLKRNNARMYIIDIYNICDVGI